MMLRWVSLIVLCSTLIVLASAWVNPIVPLASKRLPTFLAAQPTEDTIIVGESSRRHWFSQVATAAAAVVATASFREEAQAALAPEKPIAASVCDSSVSLWSKDGRRVYLLGTAHISTISAELAGRLVRDVRPEAVFVELDAKRVGKAQTRTVPISSSVGSNVLPLSLVLAAPPSMVEALPLQEAPAMQQEQGNPFSNFFGFRERALQAGSAAVGGAIKGMYSNLNTAGFNPGEEFVAAVMEGQKIGAAIVLGDRDVEVTLRRLTEALAQTDLRALMNPDSELEKSMNELLQGPPPSADMSNPNFKEEMTKYVETVKAKENVQKIMGQLKKAAPAIYQVLVEERDVYMANGLNSLNQFPTIVAVMGIAHMEGVEKTLESLGWQEVPLKCPKA